MTFPHKHILVTYGDTALLEGITQALQAGGVLTVRSVSLLSDVAALANLHPDLILVDASQVTAKQIETLIFSFSSNPIPPILSLDSNTQRLTVLSAQQYPAASLADLTQVLELIMKSM
jgi:DNA-binding response OmpR family regulator